MRRPAIPDLPDRVWQLFRARWVWSGLARGAVVVLGAGTGCRDIELTLLFYLPLIIEVNAAKASEPVVTGRLGDIIRCRDLAVGGYALKSGR